MARSRSLTGAGSGARSLAAPRPLVVGGAPVGSLLASVIRQASDVDRDGVAALVGGGDCAPFDGMIFPEPWIFQMMASIRIVWAVI